MTFRSLILYASLLDQLGVNSDQQQIFCSLTYNLNLYNPRYVHSHFSSLFEYFAAIDC